MPRPSRAAPCGAPASPCAGRSLYRLSEVLEETGADQALVKELEDYGVIKGERHDGETLYDDTEREIIRAVGELGALRGRGPQPARVPHVRRPRGRAARADPGAGAPLQVRSAARRPWRRFENLAAIASHLKHLLLIRDLRKLAR